MSHTIMAALSDEIIGNVEGSNFLDLQSLITSVLNYAIGAAAVVCVVMLIAAGYSYITASGDETKVEKATKTLTNAIIGLAICFIAVLLVNFVLDEILNNNATTMISSFFV